MTYTTILQIIISTCVVAIPLGMVLGRIVRYLWRALSLRVAPRYLTSHGVRRRATVKNTTENHGQQQF